MAPRETVRSQRDKRGSTLIRASSRAILAAVILVLCVAGVFAFRGAGRWLIREDPLAHADAIVVLSGGMPYRAEGAADLFRQGYASEVWVTRPESPAARALSAMGIHFVGEEEYSREILIHEGVPSGAIRILATQVIDTEQEIGGICGAMLSEHASSVIIVTSPEHTRRVRSLWIRIASAHQKAIVRGAAEDPFDRNHWWRNTRDAFAVVRELLGLANTWAGLPVRPHAVP
ncbi:MAG: YdcF family protein [Candidatus Acidiferrales bacterium]